MRLTSCGRSLPPSSAGERFADLADLIPGLLGDDCVMDALVDLPAMADPAGINWICERRADDGDA
jgi:hypothetical protein